MPRKARLDAPGTLHHVIIRGIERRPIVDDDKDRENFVSRLGLLAAETETSIFAWTLMTNHAHFLIKSGSFGLPNFMRRLLPVMPLHTIFAIAGMAIYFKIVTLVKWNLKSKASKAVLLSLSGVLPELN